MSSEPHLKVFMKVLNESYVILDKSPEKVKYLVNQIQATNYVTFINDEIDPTAMGIPRCYILV